MCCRGLMHGWVVGLKMHPVCVPPLKLRHSTFTLTSTINPHAMSIRPAMNRTAALPRQLIIAQKRTLHAHFISAARPTRTILTRHIPPHYTPSPLSAQARFMSVKPKVFKTTGFGLVETNDSIQEEDLLGYKAERYYPVQIGEVLHGTYQITAKLGFGTGSTVWLCRDLKYAPSRDTS